MKKSTIILTSINLIGLFLFSIHILGIYHNAKLEERNYYDFGDNLSFKIIDLPIFYFCCLLDVFWAVKAVIDIFRRDYQSVCVLTAVTLIWMVTCMIIWHLTMFS